MKIISTLLIFVDFHKTYSQQLCYSIFLNLSPTSFPQWPNTPTQIDKAPRYILAHIFSIPESICIKSTQLLFSILEFFASEQSLSFKE